MGQNDRRAGAATAALAEAIREAQGALDISTRALSETSGVPYTTLRKIRTGAQPIDFEELCKLAGALGSSPSRIARRAEIIADGVPTAAAAPDGSGPGVVAPVPPSAEGIDSTMGPKIVVPELHPQRARRTGTHTHGHS